MNNTQIRKEIINKTNGLPQESLNEILDFIQFLRKKKLKKQIIDNLKVEMTHLDKTEISHLEEEFYNYKKIYLHE